MVDRIVEFIIGLSLVITSGITLYVFRRSFKEIVKWKKLAKSWKEKYELTQKALEAKNGETDELATLKKEWAEMKVDLDSATGERDRLIELLQEVGGYANSNRMYSDHILEAIKEFRSVRDAVKEQPEGEPS